MWRAYLLLVLPMVSAVSLFSLEPEINSQDMFNEWHDFKQTHDKKYETQEEENLRFYIYQANKRMVDTHNEEHDRGEHSYRLEVGAGASDAEELGSLLKGVTYMDIDSTLRSESHLVHLWSEL